MTAYRIKTTRQFEKDVKKCIKRGLPINELRVVMELLSLNGKLPTRYRPHKLSGNYEGKWECHIRPDWLLVWEQNDTELILLFTGTGTHADLF
ncbi:MAG: type II toxin-antitoxin system YafQ family toxin [Bacteroidaceae bacterium]|nr:type II toxin-antitoxin system YafQ family toxin [Bacteroidaceae bacterium]